MAKKSERSDSTSSPVLRAKLQGADQPIAVSSMKTWWEVWRRNPDVSRAVEVLAETCAKSGVEVVKNERAFKSPETDALTNAFLEVKNEIVTSAKVGGNAFLSILRNFEGNPIGVEVLDPRNVTIYTDAVTAAPTRYVYSDKMRQMRQFTYQAEDIIHWKPIRDIDNPAYGISPIERVVYDALGDDRAAMANFSFFDNNAVPAMAIKLKDGVTQESADKLDEKLTAKFGGAKNQGKSNVLSTAIDQILPITGQDKDGKWLEMRAVSTEKICAALGVPKSILNYTGDVNYATAGEQYKIFIEQTVKPTEAALVAILDALLAPYGCTARINDEHISQAREWADIASKLFSANILTQDEAREYVGLPPLAEVAPKPVA